MPELKSLLNILRYDLRQNIKNLLTGIRKIKNNACSDFCNQISEQKRSCHFLQGDINIALKKMT